MYRDKSGVFEDFGFKLVVISSILQKDTSFSKELEEMKEKYVDRVKSAILDENYDGDEFECIPEMLQYFEELVLTEEDLALVEELVFDGGEDIYFLLIPYWDGESEEFDVQSIKGFEKLPNLKRVIYIAMCDKELMEGFKEKGIKVC